jgi:hypothetical protein
LTQVKIKPEANIITDDLLDTLGREWQYDHVKGQNEWWKNAADQYIRDDVPDDEQVILVELLETKPKKNSIFRVVDLGGMTHSDVVDAFKRWGDIRAASRNSGKRTFGGHGNGGKFYMRSAFQTSRFITYRNGRLNVFGFNAHKQYGFQEGYENVKIGLDAALKFADIDVASLPESARRRLEASEGFTVVIGERPNNFQRSATARKLLDKLTQHPQARRLVAHRPVYGRISRDEPWGLLRAYDPEPRPDFPEPLRIVVPKVLTDENGDDVVLRDAEWPEAFLDLQTSRESLRNTGINRLDVIGEIGSIASYDIATLGLPKHPAHGDFIFGELYCPKLEDPAYKCVANDRERLIDNEKSRALLAWARDRVDELAAKLADADAKERQHADLSQSSAFNELLNQWKNKFMPTLMAQLFGGTGEGSGFGGIGAGVGGVGDNGGIVSGEENDTDGDPQGGEDGGGGDEVKQGRRAPTVLLSGYDSDPLDLMAPPLELSPRQPGVYQRPADVEQGIYWINTSRPLAQRIIDEFSAESTRWRDYLFQRYVEIILKESIHTLEKTEGDLSADRLQGHIDSLYTTIYDQAFDDLEKFLFDEKLKP